MKKIIYTILSIAFVTSLSAQEQDSLGLPGDHFSLQGALEIFKNSSSLEDFEKKINHEDNYVNNLDLNEDGEIDYVRVEDHMEGDVHAIVMQVPVNDKESQDVAVIEIEKTGKESAILQIIGDEDLYGENYIVEPFQEEGTSAGKGPNPNIKLSRVVVNVWLWSPVRYIYAPTYSVYVSPFRWAYYPNWWTPWKPHPLRWHWTKRAPYRLHYRPVSVHRVTKAHVVYTPRRKSSVTVRTRTVSRQTTVVKNSNTGKTKAVTTRTTAKKSTNGTTTVGKRTTAQKGVNTKNKAATKTKTKSVKAKKGQNKAGVKKTKTKTVKKKKNG